MSLRDIRTNLHEEGGLADTWLAREEHDGAPQNATAEDGIEIAKACVETFLFVGDLDGAEFHIVELFARELRLTEDRFFISYICGGLDDCIPLAAVHAFA